MAQGRFPLFGNEATQVHRNGGVAGQKQYTGEAGHGGKGGKLRLPRISLSKKKPYDRPSSSSTLSSPLSSGRKLPLLPARLVDSASNLLTSSASYLFESFFRRRQTRWIGNGTHDTGAAGRGSIDAQVGANARPLTDSDRHPIESSIQEGGGGTVGGEDMGYVEVEEFLKQQSLSRDEVKRLTEVLLSRGYGSNAPGATLEARRCNMVEQATEDSNPVQLAKAYMGKRTAPIWQSTSSQHSEAAEPSSRKGLQAGIYQRNSLEASRARAAFGASERMLKRRLIADDEDDVVLTVPARRVRQKMTVIANSSPYIRQVTSAIGHPQIPSPAVLKHTDKSERSPEQSEDLLLPSKGKSVQDPAIATVPIQAEDLPESSKARNSVNDADSQCIVLPITDDLAECSPKLPEPAVTSVTPAPEKSVSELSSESPVSLPEKTSKTKGFHMSAFFEDSSSDEESLSPINEFPLTEAKLFGPMVHKEVEGGGTIKRPSAIPDIVPSLSGADSLKIPVPVEPQLSGDVGPLSTIPEMHAISSAALSFQSPIIVPTKEKQSLTLSSSLPAMINKDSESGELPSSTSASSAFLISSPVPVSVLPPSFFPAEASLPVPGAGAGAASASVISPALQSTAGKEAAKKESKQKIEATQTGTPEAGGLFSANVSQPMPASAESVTPSILASAAAPKSSAAPESSTVSATPMPLFVVTPTVVPAVNQAGLSETQTSNNHTVADSPLEVSGSRHSPMFESPSTENKLNDLDTMATDPMTEEPDSSIVGSTAPASLFRSSSIAMAMPKGETVTFGSGSASSPFSFPMQSSTPSEVSQSPFNSQPSSAAGQLFPFGTSGPSPANPFSSSSHSGFSFSSSAATTMSSMFPATSSAPLTFPATSPAPSPFLFGAQAISSSSTNSSSVFGGQAAPSAIGFTGGGGQNNTSAFGFQTPPTTPSPPSFQFGGVSAGTSSSLSTPSFGGQTFNFGGQPANVAANPFAQSAASNASPFQFGATATAASQPIFSSGTAPASNFAFGAQPASSPFPFTFGGQQTTASTTGQPFGFGSQPVAPAPSPFSVPGPTGQAPSGASGMDFAGGFSLGAAGGEKSGRKFIKAKRIGGAKRGK
ncbi:hypothetical protein L7F22_040941 [Adiantum nelumboides]|nr:hypothetical protein [Adiantum nelumboides]